jgi:hypothetical protein
VTKRVSGAWGSPKNWGFKGPRLQRPGVSPERPIREIFEISQARRPVTGPMHWIRRRKSHRRAKRLAHKDSARSLTPTRSRATRSGA